MSKPDLGYLSYCFNFYMDALFSSICVLFPRVSHIFLSFHSLSLSHTHTLSLPPSLPITPLSLPHSLTPCLSPSYSPSSILYLFFTQDFYSLLELYLTLKNSLKTSNSPANPLKLKKKLWRGGLYTSADFMEFLFSSLDFLSFNYLFNVLRTSFSLSL